MRLYLADESQTVDVGTGSVWYSLYSTAVVRLPEEKKNAMSLALVFLKTGECKADNAEETARQVNLVRDALALIPPENAVFDLHDVKKPAPWAGKINPVITSCANLYTTADGQDLFFEVVSLLCSAARKKQAVHVE